MIEYDKIPENGELIVKPPLHNQRPSINSSKMLSMNSFYTKDFKIRAKKKGQPRQK